MTFYDVLEVKPDATKDEIKKAYRRLQKRWHSDAYQGMKSRAKDQGADDDELARYDEMIAQAEAKLKDINEAYETLSDDDKRALYDEGLQNPQPQNANQEPPDISMSPLVLSFGKRERDSGRYSLQFVISNAGGPVLGDISLDFRSSVNWAEMEFEATDPDIFPITVNVIIDTDKMRFGNHNNAIVFEAGRQQFEIPIEVEIVVTPISTGASATTTSGTSASTQAKTSSRTGKPAQKRSSSKKSTKKQNLSRFLWITGAVIVTIIALLINFQNVYIRPLSIWVAQTFYPGRVELANVNPYNCPVWSPNGKYFVYPSFSPSGVKQITFASGEDGSSLFSVESNFEGTEYRFSPSGNYLAIISQRTLSASTEQVSLSVVSATTHQIVDSAVFRRPKFEGDEEAMLELFAELGADVSPFMYGDARMSADLHYSMNWTDDEEYIYVQGRFSSVVYEQPYDEFVVSFDGDSLSLPSEPSEYVRNNIFQQSGRTGHPSNPSLPDMVCRNGSPTGGGITYISYDGKTYFYRQ